ncbi:class I SAM-dependent DNA methyltransferase [Thomasclavelia cocleata]|uniref:class I SAM-dependent DNA methyltransferase n=1 Tax=Thomasclavelia cocleata TaxID=69824 RepID=UPI002624B1D2|nr:class I SAM-dependent methyltransferase [Thomasclavelia cocleata]
MEVFQDYAYYYNAFYQDKDYAEECNQVALLLKRYGINIKKIINYGCGTGRHDVELAKLGYQCTGIDMSPLMINIAEENSKNEKVVIDFTVADICRYVPKQKFDAVISLFHVMSYQNSNDDILAAFQSARKALDTGGIFLFDVWYGPGVLSDKPVVRVKEIQTEKYKLIRIARPIMHDKTNVVDVCYEVLIIEKKSNETKVINEMHCMRYFFRPELEFYLKKSGFELIDNVDCTTLAETGYESWTSYFVARAV